MAIHPMYKKLRIQPKTQISEAFSLLSSFFSGPLPENFELPKPLQTQIFAAQLTGTAAPCLGSLFSCGSPESTFRQKSGMIMGLLNLFPFPKGLDSCDTCCPILKQMWFIHFVQLSNVYDGRASPVLISPSGIESEVQKIIICLSEEGRYYSNVICQWEWFG